MDLTQLAALVRSKFKRLHESEIIARIMLISGRNLKRSVKGYQMLREAGTIDDLVNPETDGAMIRMLQRNPNLIDLIDRLECIPGTMNPTDFERPKKPDKKRIVEDLNLKPF